MNVNKLILRVVCVFVIALFCNYDANSQSKLTTLVEYDTLTACLCQPFEVSMYVSYSNLQNPLKVNAIDLRLWYDKDKVKLDSVTYLNRRVSDFVGVFDNGNDSIRIKDTVDFEFNIGGRMEFARFQFSPIGEGNALFVWDTLSSFWGYDQTLDVIDRYVNDSVFIGERKPIVYQLEQLVYGCSYEKKGQYTINIQEGNAPYSYLWKDSGGRKQTTENAFGLSAGNLYIAIRDTFNCRFYDSAFVRVNSAPKIDFKYDEDKTYYISKPVVQFENTSTEGFDWFWDFGDTTYSYDASPTKLFKRIGIFNVSLKGTNENSCDTTVFKTVEIKDYTLRIPNVFTPNGDGINDTFCIYLTDGEDEALLNDMFYDTEIKIFDVNGKQVFYSKRYNNDWDAGNVVDGVYLYHLWVRGQYSEQVLKGNVMVLRGNSTTR